MFYAAILINKLRAGEVNAIRYMAASHSLSGLRRFAGKTICRPCVNDWTYLFIRRFYNIMNTYNRILIKVVGFVMTGRYYCLSIGDRQACALPIFQTTIKNHNFFVPKAFNHPPCTTWAHNYAVLTVSYYNIIIFNANI